MSSAPVHSAPQGAVPAHAAATGGVLAMREGVALAWSTADYDGDAVAAEAESARAGGCLALNKREQPCGANPTATGYCQVHELARQRFIANGPDA